MKHLLILLLSLLSAAPALAQGSTTDDFEGGVNNANWTFGVFNADVIETAGGPSGSWLHNNQVDMFTVILHNDVSSGPWFGDWRATGVSRLHFDATTIYSDFGAGGRQMSVLLRDTKGTPNDVNDDDYAYSVGSLVPQVGAGWKHFNFEIPSQSTAAVPTGWKGGWVGDGTHFRPGISWNDVITSVDVVEIWWMDPALFAIFQTWDVGVDNLTLEWGMDTDLQISPALAGASNTLTMTQASANGTVRFAGSTSAGTTNFSCNGFATALGMANPHEVASATADAAGTAVATVFVPTSLAGTTVYLQGVDVSECRLSPALTVTFP